MIQIKRTRTATTHTMTIIVMSTPVNQNMHNHQTIRNLLLAFKRYILLLWAVSYSKLSLLSSCSAVNVTVCYCTDLVALTESWLGVLCSETWAIIGLVLVSFMNCYWRRVVWVLFHLCVLQTLILLSITCVCRRFVACSFF